MTVKIAIFHPDTEGLNHDARILTAGLKHLSRDLSIVAVKFNFLAISSTGVPSVSTIDQLKDINTLFCIERIAIPDGLKCDCRKILIPNPEWFGKTEQGKVALIDEVWHKTENSVRAMKPLFPNHVKHKLIWWTSDDVKRDVLQDFSKFIHIRGTSHQKQTEVILDTWGAHPEYPPLLVLNYLNDIRFLNIPFTMRRGNISIISRKLQRDELLTLANSHGLHLCPSLQEGFGHYINEAKSMGAVVVTTDAEPMNYLINQDIGYLVPVSDIKKHNLADENIICRTDIEMIINKLLSLPVRQRQQLGSRARNSYLEQKKAFIDALEKAFGND